MEDKDYMALACSLEQKSEHPLARAVLEYAEEKNVKPSEVSEFTALPGNGLSGMLSDTRLLGGSFRFISGQVSVADARSNVL